MASEGLHEPVEALSVSSQDLHRAIVSLKEELEAIDWYQQRAEAASDDALRAILVHNKNEEIEHAMMALEWLRRNDGDFARHADTYLYSTGPIHEVEEAKKAAEALAAVGGVVDAAPAQAPRVRSSPPSPPSTMVSLGIGSLRG